MRYCIAHNPLLLQPLGLWFTFIYRKCEHLAVGSWGWGLTASRGSFPLGLPCPRLLYPYCITRYGVCQEVFWTFLFGREILFYFTQLRIGERLFAPVCLFCTLIVSQLGRFVKGFLRFSLIFFKGETNAAWLSPLSLLLRKVGVLTSPWHH